ncbi:hypothetical protein FVEG_15525 [Fusarium verticillioides 7600]|uniref:Uncharacterized protein n=1 Tax=Gibberella moniliformis (strain M3125 / FGSC 7600) TaxID=334819 RepID=W7M6G3_GIBM7|nr:hypothetical protein FVEG_15525 [Fusarium verticillioides 7600]EWG43049.1 hypothetical protein FVEG_15525 [Fusarium verticillioides 7600]
MSRPGWHQGGTEVERLKADGESGGGQIRDSGQWEEGIQGLHQMQKSFVFTPGAVETRCVPARAAECRGAAAAPIHSRHKHKTEAARRKGWVERGCQVGTRMQELEW